MRTENLTQNHFERVLAMLNKEMSLSNQVIVAYYCLKWSLTYKFWKNKNKKHYINGIE